MPEILNNLLSGLVGAILGAIFSYKATIKAAKISMRESAKLEFERRQQQDNDLKRQVVSYLDSELEFNRSLTSNEQISHAKVRFMDKAFEMAKTNARNLPAGLIDLLSPIYIEIVRFNVLADYDQEKVAFGGGYLDEALKIQAKLIENKILEIKSEFNEKYLTISEEKR